MKTCTAAELPAPREVQAAVKAFLQRLRAEAPEAGDVIVFGSAARGEYKDGSDVDLLVRWSGDELAASRILAAISIDILLETGVDLAAMAIDEVHQTAWAQADTRFYQTVSSEGLVVA